MATTEDLWRDFHVEHPHVLQVHQLALQLFDACGTRLSCPAADRPLLDLAARLHDVGYHAHPGRHASAGADIILRHGVDGLSPAETETVAGAVLLHGRRGAGIDDHPLLRRPARRRACQRVASWLRVADGLDRGRLQDAQIVRAELTADGCTVLIRSPGYPGNAAAAQAKSDLWCRVFSRPFTVELSPADPQAPRYAGVVSPGDGLYNGLRKLMWRETRVMGDNLAAAVRAEDTHPLHNVRVAIRRFRNLVRIFLKPLRSTDAAAIRCELAGTCDRLGPARDLDARWEFLHQPHVLGEVAVAPEWEAFRARLAEERRSLAQGVAATLGTEAVTLTRRRLTWMLRVQLPDLMRQGDPGPLAVHGAKKLRRLLRRIGALPRPTTDTSPEALHQIRRWCRRERYLAEFLEPALRTEIEDLASRLKTVVDALGTMHDMDVLIQELQRGDGSAPACLRELARRHRADSWAVFEDAWDRLHGPAFIDRVASNLDRVRRAGRTQN